MITEKPFVSLVIPCLNEAAFIDGVIRDIIQQDYPDEQIEILFIDGGSTDRTRAVIQQQAEADHRFQLIDNPARFVPQAMNIGIRASRGQLIIRLDAHGSYPANYVSQLVYWSHKTQAENVGAVGETRPRTASAKAQAIAAVLSHRIGVGNSLFRVGVDQPTEADTVPFGCYPREVFERFGMYNERLVRNQDIEFNKRIRRMGGKILLVPDIRVIYYARDRFKGVWRNNYQTGRWVPLTMYYAKSTDALSLRHMIPLFFATYLLILLPLFLFLGSKGLVPGWILVVLLIPGILYALLAMAAATQIGVRSRSYLVGCYALISIPLIHLAYGIGTAQGLLETLWAILKRK